MRVTKVGSGPRGTHELMCSRVDLEGSREISTWHDRAFRALAVGPRDGATGSHDRESLLVTARSQDTNGLDMWSE